MFESRLELFARADSTEQVLHGASILLARLVAWLAAQHAFVRRFRLLMHHETRWQQGDRTPQATSLEIALAEPSRDSEHLLVLLRERLAQVQLPAPTLEIALQAEDIVKRAAPNSELFPTRQSENEGLTRLIERLQARLGADQVQRLAGVDDHRPERASRGQRADASGRPARASPRGGGRARVTDARAATGSASAATVSCASHPVWLHPVAEPLAERRSRPLLDGRPLQLVVRARSGSRRAGGTPSSPSATTSSPRPPTARWSGSTARDCRYQPRVRTKAAGFFMAASAENAVAARAQQEARAFSGALRRSA